MKLKAFFAITKNDVLVFTQNRQRNKGRIVRMRIVGHNYVWVYTAHTHFSYAKDTIWRHQHTGHNTIPKRKTGYTKYSSHVSHKITSCNSSHVLGKICHGCQDDSSGFFWLWCHRCKGCLHLKCRVVIQSFNTFFEYARSKGHFAKTILQVKPLIC